MYVGALELDVLLGDVHSLKQKRSVVRPVLAELRRRFEVAVAEAGHLDLHRRALLGVGCVAADAGHVDRGARRAASGWSPPARSWSCSRPGTGCWARRTTERRA